MLPAVALPAHTTSWVPACHTYTHLHCTATFACRFLLSRTPAIPLHLPFALFTCTTCILFTFSSIPYTTAPTLYWLPHHFPFLLGSCFHHTFCSFFTTPLPAPAPYPSPLYCLPLHGLVLHAFFSLHFHTFLTFLPATYIKVILPHRTLTTHGFITLFIYGSLLLHTFGSYTLPAPTLTTAHYHHTATHSALYGCTGTHIYATRHTTTYTTPHTVTSLPPHCPVGVPSRISPASSPFLSTSSTLHQFSLSGFSPPPSPGCSLTCPTCLCYLWTLPHTLGFLAHCYLHLPTTPSHL